MKLAKKAAVFILYLYVLFHFAMWCFGFTANFYTFLSTVAFFAICIHALLAQVQKRGIISNSMAINVKLAGYTFLAALVVTEIACRYAFTDLSTSIEKSGADYCSSWAIPLKQCDSCGKRAFYINEPGDTTPMRTAEFNYPQHFNSLGLRDREFKTRKDTDEYRILALGDSFVEGAGTSADSTWVKLLQYLLNGNQDSIQYTTYNAGVSGSDLFYNYDLLENCLLKYQPNLVILNLNSTDVIDTYRRGGPERYDAKGNYHLKTGPWWEFFFASSYIVRAVTLHALHYSWNLEPAKEQKAIDERITQQISEKLKDYQALAEKNHFTFLLVLQPLRSEFNDSSFISKLTVAQNIRKVDLTRALMDSINNEKGNLAAFIWPIDRHFNSRGYHAEADIIYHDYFLAGNR